MPNVEPVRPAPPSPELAVYVTGQRGEIKAFLALARRFLETGSETDAYSVQESADAVVGRWSAWHGWTVADLDDSRGLRSFVLAVGEMVSRLNDAAADSVGAPASAFARAVTTFSMMNRYENVLELVPDALAAFYDVSAAAGEPSPAAVLDTSEPAATPAPEAPTTLPDLVTLDQMAAAVHRCKKTLERRKTAGKLPPPFVEGGGGGKPDLWDWAVARPWLTGEFGVPLPERFPGNVR